ncbi:MAG TPA: hypothetical protein EYP10_11365 [Armatimonadetes bacterium]|nr:hypothetical protein [Armatimonadota bacterium]
MGILLRLFGPTVETIVQGFWKHVCRYTLIAVIFIALHFTMHFASADSYLPPHDVPEPSPLYEQSLKQSLRELELDNVTLSESRSTAMASKSNERNDEPKSSVVSSGNASISNRYFAMHTLLIALVIAFIGIATARMYRRRKV